MNFKQEDEVIILIWPQQLATVGTEDTGFRAQRS